MDLGYIKSKVVKGCENTMGDKVKNIYRYRLTRLHATSDKYGNCEICGKFVADVHIQTESRGTLQGNWTYAECHNLFGHFNCLMDARR